jgi:chromosome segregation ATPase
MAEIAELEQRITAALARISAGVERLTSASDLPIEVPYTPQDDQIASLRAELDRERAMRLAADTALNEMRSPVSGAEAAEVERLTRQLDAQGLDNQRLRSSVSLLREELRRLREAVEGGLADAPLVNRALQAELDGLRAVRASETTEIADILAALGPLVEAEEAETHA